MNQWGNISTPALVAKTTRAGTLECERLSGQHLVDVVLFAEQAIHFLQQGDHIHVQWLRQLGRESTQNLLFGNIIGRALAR